MPGRKKQPIEVIEARGKSHIGYDESYERKRREPHSPDTAIVPPDYLKTKRDRSEFQRSELDADELARYIVAERTYESYVPKLKRAIQSGDVDEATKLQRLEVAQAEQARKSASALGMNITSRCKLVVPVPNDDEYCDV